METSEETLTLLEKFHIFDIGQALLIVVAGFMIARLVSNGITKLTVTRLSTHSNTLLKRGIYYFILVLMLISALRELGFDLSVVLGAAGILTVAIGFASQTSASNLISGLFLMVERPFSIGDVIKVDPTLGEVISIDLLSVKIRTFDNLFVRIPNETMIKQQVTTLTKFPIRRADLRIGIAYKEDIERVQKLLMQIADAEPTCLAEPEPLFILTGFGTSSIDIQFSIWTRREQFLQVRNLMYQKIKRAFDENNIEIPFPHVTVYSGEKTRPMPVDVTLNSENRKVD